MIVGKENLALGRDSPLIAAERMLRTPPPAISVTQAEAFVQLHYGRCVSARLLSGERDRNFLVAEASGWSAVLKFYNAADSAETRALQHGALTHVRRCAPTCPVPEIVPTLEGTEEVTARLRDADVAAVMIAHLPGVTAAAQDLSPELRTDLSRALGTLSRALADYDHPCAGRAILWDMMLVAELRPLSTFIEDVEARRSIQRWIDTFEAEILPATRRLPHQAIHNDVSLSNVLVDPEHRARVVGIIDFGDIVRAPRVNEFAVAASYFISPSEEPATAMFQLLRGAGPSIRFERAEIELLPSLVQARLATRILLSGWRAKLFPDNHAYILRSNRAAWRNWEKLASEDAAKLGNRIATLCDGVME